MKNIRLLCILLAIFLVVSVPLILLDQFVFRVQYPEAFIYNGMPLADFFASMGNPDRNVGYGEVILEYDMDDGRILRVYVSKDYANNMNDIVTNCRIEPGGDPSMNRWILPIILVIVALIEIIIFGVHNILRKKKAQIA